MKFTKPQRLQAGDTIAVLAPCGGAAHRFPWVYESGLKNLEKYFGLKIKECPTARKSADFLYKNPKARAEDINAAFADKTVKAIITAIGGDDSIRILPYINPKIIKQNPKIFMSFSDGTTMTTYFNQLGLVTFNGPNILAGLSQKNNFPKSFAESFKNILFRSKAVSYFKFQEYFDGYPDWADKKNIGKVKPAKKTDGWHWLQGLDVAKGELFGGCIEVMDFLNGTKFWPKPDFWENKILFLETSEEKPSPQQVKYWLRNLGMQGIFDKVNGLLFGRARDYNEKEKAELEKNILEVVVTEFGKNGLPIVANMDFGHTDPQQIMPLGIKAEVNCKNKTFRLLEPAVS